MRILFVDLETSPHLAWAWGKYDITTIKNVQDSQILSFAWKWLGEKQVYCMAQSDYKQYKKGKLDDKFLVQDLWDVLNKADVVVAHNGNRFDSKVANARFIFHKINPPAPFKTVDTKVVAKATGMFPSNKLDDLAQYFGVGKKMNTGGFELWEECMQGNEKAWAKMKSYNKQDVAILEPVYLRLLPWVKNHPNHNVYNGTERNCPSCGTDSLVKRGYALTRVGKKERFQCNSCGAYCTGAFSKTDVVAR